MSERKNRAWVGWAIAILLIVVVGYPLSIGPVLAICWYDPVQELIPSAGWSLILALYRPLLILVDRSPNAIQHACNGYFEWWTRVELPIFISVSNS